MLLDRLVSQAREARASDLHLEGGMPPGLRVRGELRLAGEPVSGAELTELARELIGDGWGAFLERRSFDLARVVAGVRCRINVLQTTRGVGLAVRLLAPFQATLARLNLHPSLRKLVEQRHGLIIVTGATGSGKSTTLAALIQEINLAEARHIVTIENPIEYVLSPRRSLIRQREVGRHTPSVSQALLDALREDPDVLMVGEMRDPETMRLTLNAAETGHLVLTTMHSGSCAEALQRVVSAFAPEVQAGIASQLADSLVAVVCQRLRFRADLEMLVPECEILMASTGARGVIRQSQFFKLGSALESGGQEGSWSFARYHEWLASKTDWSMPGERAEPAEWPVEPPPPTGPALAKPVARPTTRASVPVKPTSPAKPTPAAAPAEGVVVIDEAEDPADVLAQLDGGQ